jgi:hypothetical protein
MCATVVCGRVRSPTRKRSRFLERIGGTCQLRDIYEPIITYHLDTVGGIVKHCSAVATWNGHALGEWK